MKTTCLGFSSVICCSLALAPLLVQTDRIWAQSPEPTAVQAVAIAANGQCSDPFHGPLSDGSTARLSRSASVCLLSPGFRIAEAR